MSEFFVVLRVHKLKAALCTVANTICWGNQRPVRWFIDCVLIHKGGVCVRLRVSADDQYEPPLTLFPALTYSWLILHVCGCYGSSSLDFVHCNDDHHHLTYHLVELPRTPPPSYYHLHCANTTAGASNICRSSCAESDPSRAIDQLVAGY